MNVIMLIDNYFPLVGGAERQVDALGRKLIERGVNVKIVTEKKEKSWKEYEVINGIPVQRIPFPKIKILGPMILFLKLALYLFRIRKKYDIIHVHIVKYFAFVGTLMGKLLGKKVILKMAGPEELDTGILNDVLRKKLLYRILTWGVVKADFFIAISSKIESALKRCDFPYEKIVCIPNGVDSEVFCPDENKMTLQKRLMGSDLPVVGIFAGRLVNDKGLPYLLDAWKEITKTYPDAYLYILGSGPLESILMDITMKHDLNERVIFKGLVENVHEYMKAADFLILPSISEGLSNTLLEAMASGLPVIGTRISGTEDLIIENKNGFLVPPKDSLSLAVAIKSLLENRNLMRNMGKESRRMIEEGYSIDRVTDKYVELYGNSI